MLFSIRQHIYEAQFCTACCLDKAAALVWSSQQMSLWANDMIEEVCTAPHLSSGHDLRAVAEKMLFFDQARCPIAEC